MIRSNLLRMATVRSLADVSTVPGQVWGISRSVHAPHTRHSRLIGVVDLPMSVCGFMSHLPHLVPGTATQWPRGGDIWTISGNRWHYLSLPAA